MSVLMKMRDWAGHKMQVAAQLYNQGENDGAVKKALKYIGTIKKHMIAARIVQDENTIDQYFAQLHTQLQGLLRQIQTQQGPDRSAKFGNGIAQVGCGSPLEFQVTGHLSNQGEAAVKDALKYIAALKKHMIATEIVPDENMANHCLGQLQTRVQGLLRK